MFYIILFVLGAIWGSFANVCIYRIPKNQGVEDKTKEATAENDTPEDKETTGESTGSDEENKELDT